MSQKSSLSLTLGVLRGVPLMAIGGGYFWWGGVPSIETADLNGATSFHLIALLFIFGGIVVTFYSAMKAIAPRRSNESAPLDEEPGFDPDAAIARYLAQRHASRRDVAVPPAARKVFGRKAPGS